ncbi:MAG: adenylate/guanylate cyclase domain-containing protein [Planctomycetaceae bacterium]|nr:adenylate/guanylate cyclase domain-containing protein [Planctomycetaceae bacterium]
MAELVVSGPEDMQRWRRPLPPDEVVRLGRAPRNGWAVPWDDLISREHAELSLQGNRLTVRRLEAARNPIYYQETNQREFTIGAGEEFRIGKTMFQLAAAEINEASPSPLEEHQYRSDELKKFKFKNADHRLEVLSKLPSAISEANSDAEIAQGLVSLLLEAMPHSDAAAVVQYDEDPTKAEKPTMMRWDSRAEDIGRFNPSRRLILAALQKQQGIMHVWQDCDESDPTFTISGDLDWAFCIPIKEEACKGWCLYVSGQFGGSMSSSEIVSEDDLKGDLRFTEMLAEFIAAIRQVRVLEQTQAGLAQFFSPTVMEHVRADSSASALEPKESDITVLFCDVRGFSKATEQSGNLYELLNRVSDALGVMTTGIIKYDGVIADFQGDAALGFWGWPQANEADRLSACLAALQVQRTFVEAEKNKSSLTGFKVGIGIAYGRAIAGRIGTTEQIKVGAFGPVVNMGARLETMTKQLRASILIDEETAIYARENLTPEQGRVRDLIRVIPAGMKTAMTVAELLPPVSEDGSITDENIQLYEAALKMFNDGDWSGALEQLDTLPVEDRRKDFMHLHIAQNSYEPPEDWNGVIKLSKK